MPPAAPSNTDTHQPDRSINSPKSGADKSTRAKHVLLLKWVFLLTTYVTALTILSTTHMITQTIKSALPIDT